jgi:hypothetical protein
MRTTAFFGLAALMEVCAFCNAFLASLSFTRRDRFAIIVCPKIWSHRRCQERV